MKRMPFEILSDSKNYLVGRADIMDIEPLLPDINLLPEEQNELDRIKNPTYKKQWINSRWLAVQCRNLLKADIPEISKSLEGRPYVKNSNLHISLSHNANMSSVMISNSACGVDVEAFREKIHRVSHKFLNEKENLDLKNKTEYLTLIWSAKESIYKMLDIPGLIFRDQIICSIDKIEDSGEFACKVLFDSKTSKSFRVTYHKYKNDLLTFCCLTDTF